MWSAHALLLSVSLLPLGAVAWIAVRAAGSDAVVAYRALVLVLAAALALPFAQALSAGRAERLGDALLERIADGATIARDAPPPAIPLASPAPETAPRARLQSAAAALSASGAPLNAVAASPPPHAASAPRRGLARWSDLDRRTRDAALAVYLAGAAAYALALFARLRRTRRLVRAAEPVRDETVLALWNRVAAGERRLLRARLSASPGIAAPACWGLLRPVVLLPAAPRTRGPALEWALRHEAEHVRARDPWIATAQAVLRVVLWFHPVAWWLGRALDRWRELACDQLVVRRTGARKTYARALLDYAAALAPPLSAARAASPLLHWSSAASSRKRRIEMLLFHRRSLSPRRRLLLAGSAALAIALFAGGQMTVAAAFLGDDPLDARLVACCDKKTMARPPRPNVAPPPPPAQPRHGIGAAPRFLDWQIRPAVASGAVDPQIRDALLKALRDDEAAAVRMTAAGALAPLLGDEEVKQAFIRTLRHGEDDAVDLALVTALMEREPISADMKDLLVRVFAGAGVEPAALELDALFDDADEVAQLHVAEAFAARVDEPEIRRAFVRFLRESGNEVARMSALHALGPWVRDDDPVRETFLLITKHDDNGVARMEAARALAAAADHAPVREGMMRALLEEGDEVVQMTLVRALRPYVHQPEVKQTFIAVLERASNHVVKKAVVETLATALGTGASADPLLDLFRPAQDVTPANLFDEVRFDPVGTDAREPDRNL